MAGLMIVRSTFARTRMWVEEIEVLGRKMMTKCGGGGKAKAEG